MRMNKRKGGLDGGGHSKSSPGGLVKPTEPVLRRLSRKLLASATPGPGTC